jgi:hypothetical protein
MNDTQRRLHELETRNKRVERDKAWEGSWVRRGIVAAVTYLTALTYMSIIGDDAPLVHACIPTGGYLFSGATLRFVRDRLYR